jgi:lysophospholipase L1-like esterase
MMSARKPSSLRLWPALLLAAAALLAACGERVPDLPRIGSADVVLAFGDSLTYGTGAAPEESYPAVLAAIIGRTVVRSGVPGELSGEALARLPAALDEHQPVVLLLCSGGNDLLRRMDEGRVEANLRAMIELARSRGVAVVLIGVPKPRLIGGPPEFYARLAQEYRLPYEGEIVKDLLFDNATKSDMIHPNADGYRRMAEALARLLREAGAV